MCTSKPLAAERRELFGSHKGDAVRMKQLIERIKLTTTKRALRRRLSKPRPVRYPKGGVRIRRWGSGAAHENNCPSQNDLWTTDIQCRRATAIARVETDVDIEDDSETSCSRRSVRACCVI